MSGRPRFGELPRRYRFALNPYPDVRWSRCPRCEGLTHERKFPLLIHLGDLQRGDLDMVTLGKTCRYCTGCEFIVAHKHELEAEIDLLASQRGLHIGPGEYFVIGVVERKTWKKGLEGAMVLDEMRASLSEFKEVYQLADPRPRWIAIDADPSK